MQIYLALQLQSHRLSLQAHGTNQRLDVPEFPSGKTEIIAFGQEEKKAKSQCAPKFSLDSVLSA